MERPVPLPALIVTGFLGAGKTTLINRWVKEPAFEGALVIVNEFGEIGLDHLLIENATDDIILLPSGCLCCAVRGELSATLEDLLRRRDNGRIAPFRRIVIETSGIADPAPVLASFRQHPYFPLRFEWPGIVTIVDAVNARQTFARQPESVRQAALADLLIISKTDLLPSADEGESLRNDLRAINPLAPMLDASEASAERIVADIRAQASALKDLQNIDAANEKDRHAAGVGSFSLTSDAPVRPENLDLFLELLRASKGADLLRVKGLVNLAGAPETPLAIHAVQHLLHPPRLLDRWPDASRATRLVFIMREIDPAFVANLWDAFQGKGAATLG